MLVGMIEENSTAQAPHGKKACSKSTVYWTEQGLTSQSQLTAPSVLAGMTL